MEDNVKCFRSEEDKEIQGSVADSSGNHITSIPGSD